MVAVVISKNCALDVSMCEWSASAEIILRAVLQLCCKVVCKCRGYSMCWVAGLLHDGAMVSHVPFAATAYRFLQVPCTHACTVSVH